MQYSSIILSILAATSATAQGRGAHVSPDDQVSVLIQNSSLGRSFTLSGVERNAVRVRESEPIETVSLSVTGANVDPDLRCQIVGAKGPIVVIRGENVDITFSDADKGPWTLQHPTVVQKIICDPAFEAASA